MRSDGLVVLVLFGGYFLPAIVAAARHHRQRMAISVLNFLVGWTLIGWVVALVWSFTRDVEIDPRRPHRDFELERNIEREEYNAR